MIVELSLDLLIADSLPFSFLFRVKLFMTLDLITAELVALINIDCARGIAATNAGSSTLSAVLTV